MEERGIGASESNNAPDPGGKMKSQMKSEIFTWWNLKSWVKRIGAEIFFKTSRFFSALPFKFLE